VTGTLFISYAQNGEDVMLRRALKHIETGCYVDVGAADPILDSVTCAFYLAGWRGINIEPSPEAFKKLAAARPDDININVAAGEVDGEMPFYLIEGADVLGTGAPEQLEVLNRQGHRNSEIKVPVRRLQSITAAHARETVHFLKIDVEGLERAVLAGADFTKFRPWIVVIEATAPNAPAPTHQNWEHLLTAAGYDFAWFDGLNRFYLAAEHPELAAAFAAPPNVFDHYMRYGEAAARLQLAEANFRLAVADELHKEIIAAMNTAQETLTRKGAAKKP
jgi:FkbM family methyltransferase